MCCWICMCMHMLSQDSIWLFECMNMCLTYMCCVCMFVYLYTLPAKWWNVQTRTLALSLFPRNWNLNMTISFFFRVLVFLSLSQSLFSSLFTFFRQLLIIVRGEWQVNRFCALRCGTTFIIFMQYELSLPRTLVHSETVYTRWNWTDLWGSATQQVQINSIWKFWIVLTILYFHREPFRFRITHTNTEKKEWNSRHTFISLVCSLFHFFFFLYFKLCVRH